LRYDSANENPISIHKFLHRSFERSALLSVLLLLACFALSPDARAVCQQGCLTNDKTVLGDEALVSNTSGNSNTAIGGQTLNHNTTAYDNTAVGYFALFSNISGIDNTATGPECSLTIRPATLTRPPVMLRLI
jgi:hypothetical protein